MADRSICVHGTCVVIDGAGMLIRGEPGTGKSDLALRLIDAGAGLVADDQVVLRCEGPVLTASSPDGLRGKLEVRGLGICTVPFSEAAAVDLVIDLVPREAVERLPRPATCSLLELDLPVFAIAPFEPSAVAKVRIAVAIATGNSKRLND